MTKEIKIGLVNEARIKVTEANIASTMGSGSLRVFATPAMCALMEKAASDLMDSLVEDGSTTVGTALNIAHTAATPIGMEVVATAEITAVEGRKISFRVTARDQAGEIGAGTHERFIVFKEKFQAKPDAKIDKD